MMEKSSKKRDYTKVPKPPGRESEPLVVECTFGVPKIAHIDTVNSTAFVKIFLNLWWEDYRFVNTIPEELPKDVWTPQPTLINSLSDMSMSDEPVVLKDPSTGLLFYCVLFEGMVDNSMNLQEFPFDSDALEIHFTTTSDSVQMKGTPRQQAHDFVFRPVNPDRGMHQVNPEWDGKMTEFTLKGYSVYSREKQTSTGDCFSYLTVDFWLQRKSKYFVYKYMIPITSVFLLGCSQMIIDPKELSDRLSMSSTMFLTAIALMYVLSESVPKTDFLTCIDKLVIFTTASLITMVPQARIALWVQTAISPSFASNFDFWCLLAYILIYFITFDFLVGTKMRKTCSEMPADYTKRYRKYKNKTPFFPAQFKFAEADDEKEDPTDEAAQSSTSDKKKL